MPRLYKDDMRLLLAGKIPETALGSKASKGYNEDNSPRN
jgi:hypothetical protein